MATVILFHAKSKQNKTAYWNDLHAFGMNCTLLTGLLILEANQALLQNPIQALPLW